MRTRKPVATSHAPLAVSVPEAGAMLALGRRTTEKLIAEKAIESRKVGSRRVVLVDSLRRFLAEGARAQ